MWTLNIADALSFKNHTLIMLDPCSWCTCGLTWLIGIGMLAPGNLICHFSTGILTGAREIIQDFSLLCSCAGQPCFFSLLAFLERFSKNACVLSEVLFERSFIIIIFPALNERTAWMWWRRKEKQREIYDKAFFIYIYKKEITCAVSSCDI